MNDKDLLKGLNDLKIFLGGHNYVNAHANNTLEYCIINHSSKRQMQRRVRNASGVTSDEQNILKCPVCGGIMEWENKTDIEFDD